MGKHWWERVHQWYEDPWASAAEFIGAETGIPISKDQLRWYGQHISGVPQMGQLITDAFKQRKKRKGPPRRTPSTPIQPRGGRPRITPPPKGPTVIIKQPDPPMSRAPDKPGYRKTTTTKKRKTKKKRNTIQKRLKKLERATKLEWAFIKKVDGSGTLESSIGQCKFAEFNLGRLSDIKTIISDADPMLLQVGAAPGEPQQSANQGTKRYFIKNYRQSICLKNNGNSVVHLEVFYLVARRGQDASVLTVMDTSAADAGISGYSRTAITNNLLQHSLVQKYFKVYSRKKHELAPGDKLNLHQRCPFMKHDPQEDDEATIPNFKNKQSRVIVVRFYGDIAHDTTTDSLVSFAPGELDYVTFTSAQVSVGNSAQITTGVQSVSNLGAVAAAEGVNNPADHGIVSHADQ